MSASRQKRVVRLAPRRRVLNAATVASLEDMAAEAKSGGVTAVVAVASRPGRSLWILRSNMTTSERVNLIGQLEYLKLLLLQDTEEDIG